jgi:hypothetical protein
VREHDILLHKTLLRTLKAAIAAWETWLKVHIEDNVGEFSKKK